MSPQLLESHRTKYNHEFRKFSAYERLNQDVTESGISYLEGRLMEDLLRTNFLKLAEII